MDTLPLAGANSTFTHRWLESNPFINTATKHLWILLLLVIIAPLMTRIRTRAAVVWTFHLGSARDSAAASYGRALSPPPGAWRIPVIGSVWTPGRGYFRVLSDLRDRYGDVFRMTIGVRDVVVLNGWRTVTAALGSGSRTARSLAGRPDLHAFRIASEGQTMSFNSYSPEWKLHRRLAERALARAVSATDFVETTVAREARVLLDALIDKSKLDASTTPGKRNLMPADTPRNGNKIPVDENPSPSLVSFDPEVDIKRSIGHVMFSLCYGDSRRDDSAGSPERNCNSTGAKQLSTDEEDDVETILSSSECIVRSSQDAASIVDFFPWARRLVRSKLASLDRICAAMLATTRRLTAEHRATRGVGVVRDVVDALIEAADETAAGRQLGADRVEMTVQEFIGAGFDILAAAASWVVAYMAEYPEIQERVRREADDAAAAVGASSEAHQSSSTEWCRGPQAGSSSPVGMTFAEAVVLEVLRHSCVVPLALPHAATEDTKINGYDIRSGAFVLVNLQSVCRDKTFWSDPEFFSPDRFMPKTVMTTSSDCKIPTQPQRAPDSDAGCDADATAGEHQSLHACDRPSTVSFGIGKRRCVGERLSCRVLVAYLTTLVQGCYIERPQGVARLDLTPSDSNIILLKPKPYRITVLRRKDEVDSSITGPR